MHVFGISIKQSTRSNWTLPQLFCRTGRSSATKTLNFEMAMPQQLMSSTKINHVPEDCKWSILYSTKCFYPTSLSITTALSQFTLTPSVSHTSSFLYLLFLCEILYPQLSHLHLQLHLNIILLHICTNSVSFHLIIFVYCFVCFFFLSAFAFIFGEAPTSPPSL